MPMNFLDILRSLPQQGALPTQARGLNPPQQAGGLGQGPAPASTTPYAQSAGLSPQSPIAASILGNASPASVSPDSGLGDVFNAVNQAQAAERFQAANQDDRFTKAGQLRQQIEGGDNFYGNAGLVDNAQTRGLITNEQADQLRASNAQKQQARADELGVAPNKIYNAKAVSAAEAKRQEEAQQQQAAKQAKTGAGAQAAQQQNNLGG